MSYALPQVSVIVPIYNTPKKYLDVALEGIKNQTYKNIQVILVDDGSDEETARYLDSYTKAFSMWQVVHQKNKGLAAARNNGYKLATGKYIQFLDGDDIFDSNLIANAINRAEQTSADIVVENFIARDYHTGRETTVLSEDDFPKQETFRLTDIKKSKFQTIPYSVWSKLFRKKFLDNNRILHDEELLRSEDVLFTYSALVVASKITLITDCLIVYRENLPSSNTKTNDISPTISVKAWKKMYQFLDERGLYNTYKDDFETAMTASIFWHFERLQQEKNKKELASSSVKLFNQLNVATINDPRTILELTYANSNLVPIFIDKSRQIQQLHEEVNNLQNRLSELSLELEASRKPGIKIATRKLAGAIKRHIKGAQGRV